MPQAYIKLTCAICNKQYQKSAGHYNRAMKLGAKLFCSQTCFGLSRRQDKSIEEKKAEKAAYDAQYREKNLEALKAKKAAHYAANHDREKEKAYRQKRMPQHVKYCQRPEYKAWKAKYDELYRAKKQYGEFYEAGLAMKELDKFLESKRIKYESGQFNKSQNRKRKWQQQES